ncbi:MAG: hypothetical protein IPO92_17980 [Saprospiraceae bacterium]|nr:hypothetical protein [Saprospiraceae bacterium]
MSYCHLTSYGINFNLGFGPQPGNLMRQKVEIADCIESNNTACTAAKIKLSLNLDSKPAETYWTLRNDKGEVLYKSFEYKVPNSKVSKYLCLEDGTYYFTCYDDIKKNPWELIALQSTINIDGNDGTSQGSSLDGFNLHTPKLFTDHVQLNIKDPADFLYNVFSNDKISLNGKVTFGGGDDTISASSVRGFRAHFGNIPAYLVADTIVINGGMDTENRATFNSNNEQIVAKTFVINTNTEYRGGTTLFGNLINNGLYTQQQTRTLAFCGDVHYLDYFMNTKNSQSISGSGLFRNFDKPVPASQDGNYISRLHVANSFSGLHLNMPLGVSEVLRLRSNINNGNNIFTLGDATKSGLLITMPNDPWSYYGTSYPFDTISSLQTYDGGYINGKMRRWFNGNTNKIFNGIFPVSSGNSNHPVLLRFDNTNIGHVVLRYRDSIPSVAGMPIGLEQNTQINNISPDGYWESSAVNVSGKFSIAVNAHNFTEDGVNLIQDLEKVRLVRTNNAGNWNTSESETSTGPGNLNFIKSDSLFNFGTFGVGNGNCKYVINENDSNLGSLRYAIDSCSSSGDIIYFSRSLDTIHLNIDTIVINKNLTLDFNHQHALVVDGSNTNIVFMITSGAIVHIKNIRIKAGNGMNGSAILNNGALTLENTGIFKTTGSNELLNQGTLEIIGPNFIKIH